MPCAAIHIRPTGFGNRAGTATLRRFFEDAIARSERGETIHSLRCCIDLVRSQRRQFEKQKAG